MLIECAPQRLEIVEAVLRDGNDGELGHACQHGRSSPTGYCLSLARAAGEVQYLGACSEDVGRARRHVSIQHRQRGGRHDPTRPVDPEAQRAKALVEHPVRGCAEHTDPIRREALCRAAQSLDDDVGGCLWRSANGRTDVSVLIGPTYRRNLVAIEQREARAGAGEELVHGGTVQSERRWLESTPCAARLVAGESYDSWIIALSLLSACSDKWSLGRAQMP